MRAREAAFRVPRPGNVGLWLGCLVLLCGAGAAAWADVAARDRREEGRELFLREWTPGDSRSHGGDGLGPVYNDTSCVACHNAGGAGGGGPKSKNVDIVSAFPTRAGTPALRTEAAGFLQKSLTALTGIEPPRPTPTPSTPPRPPDTGELIKAHAGFRTARSVVLHRFGTDPDYEHWRRGMTGQSQFMRNSVRGIGQRLLTAQAEIDQVKTLLQFGDNARGQAQVGEFALVQSQRNPTALFGAGLIDTIPDEVLEAAARVEHPDRPGVSGRVSRQKDGRIGRFGWKAQTPRLEDFVRTACAVELGLDVPGHHQGGLPQRPEMKPAGLDLSDAECESLLAYVASLPRPAEFAPAGGSERKMVETGKATFERIGCASCHTATLGSVEGIYSDLLLHDMGPDLGDTGAYGVFVPDSSEPDVFDSTPPVTAEGAAGVPAAVTTTTTETTITITTETVVVPDPAAPAPGAARRARRPTGPATRQEWRTPPLWGFRDSGPYLHDGRAATLEEAVALHGGEAANPAREFFGLSTRERQQVEAFLKTLAAPVDRSSP